MAGKKHWYVMYHITYFFMSRSFLNSGKIIVIISIIWF
jgi:hypothetical protein